MTESLPYTFRLFGECCEEVKHVYQVFNLYVLWSLWNKFFVVLYSVSVELSGGFVKFPTLAGVKPPIGEAASWSRIQ